MSDVLWVYVPADERNASVRTRVTHWLRRIANADGRELSTIASITGPGFAPAGSTPAPGGRVLVARNASRFSRGRREARLLSAAGLGVYDLDDGLPWDDGRLPGLGRWWKRPWPRSLIARRAAGAADRVVVGNAVLAEWAAGHCDDVRIIPTCVEPDDCVRKSRYEVADRPVIGWIGSPATEQYLLDVAAALCEVHRRTGAVLEVMSGPGEVPPEMALFATHVPWSEAAAAHIGERWDVGIMPLRDGVYERAKCGYKLLQYGAAGVPAVGSPVGVNREMLARGDGLAPATPGEWVDALVAVLQEPADRRRRRGAAGRVLAEEHSYDRWEPEWRAAMGFAPASPR